MRQLQFYYETLIFFFTKKEMISCAYMYYKPFSIVKLYSELSIQAPSIYAHPPYMHTMAYSQVRELVIDAHPPYSALHGFFRFPLYEFHPLYMHARDFHVIGTTIYVT